MHGSVDFGHIQKHNLQTKELDTGTKAQTKASGTKIFAGNGASTFVLTE